MRPKLTYANVMATLAVFLVLTGERPTRRPTSARTRSAPSN